MLITHQSCWGCGLSWIHFISCGANSACFARVSRGKPILKYIMSKFLKQKRKEKKENLGFAQVALQLNFFYLFHLIFSQFMSRRYSTNPAIWLVPREGSILPIWPAHSGQYPEKYFEVFLEAFLNHLFFIFICIALVFSTIYSLINCSIYGESCRNNSPLSFRFFSQPFVKF